MHQMQTVQEGWSLGKGLSREPARSRSRLKRGWRAERRGSGRAASGDWTGKWTFFNHTHTLMYTLLSAMKKKLAFHCVILIWMMKILINVWLHAHTAIIQPICYHWITYNAHPRHCICIICCTFAQLSIAQLICCKSIIRCTLTYYNV